MSSPGDPKAIVAAGYDAVGRRYLEWSALRPSAVRLRWLAGPWT